MAAMPALRNALTAFHSEETGTEEGLRWLWLAGRTAGFIWDYESWDSLTARQVRAAREVGALGHLPLAFSTRVGVHLFAGELQAAASLVEQSDALAEATYGRIVPLYGALALAAFRGSEDEVTRLVRTNTQDFIDPRRGGWAHRVPVGDGRALQRAGPLRGCVRRCRGRDHGSTRAVVLDLRDGRAHRSRQPQRQNRPRRRGPRAVERIHGASGTPWALGVEARSRALLTARKPPRRCYRSRSTVFEPTRLRMDLARAHLLYGEWLRRQRRRLDARDQLRVAHELFSDFGMEAFAGRRGRTAGDGRARPETDRRHASTSSPRRRRRSPASPPGATRTADRRSAVHQPEHGRVPPPQGVPEARREVTHAARPPHAPV